MKITLISHLFLPDFTAGTEVLTYNTAKTFQKLGHEVNVITSYPVLTIAEQPEPFDEYEYDGIPVKRYFHCNERMRKLGNIVIAGYHNTFFNTWFDSYLNTFKPDVIQAFHLSHLSASAIDICNKHNIPIVFTPTDFWFICLTYQLRLPNNDLCHGPDKHSLNCLRHTVAKFQPSWLYKVFELLPDTLLLLIVKLTLKSPVKLKLFENIKGLYNRHAFMIRRLNSVQKVISPSNVMTMMLCANGLNEDLVTKVPFGISKACSEITASEQKSESLKLGYIGSISDHKGLHVLIDAVQRCSKEQPIEVLIYGDTKHYPEYTKELMLSIGLDGRFKFMGTFNSKDIYSVIQGFDILVVPSIWYENTPLVVYSAQVVKTPVIASNLGGLSEVIKHNINGLLFDAGNASQLYELIQQLLNDPNLINKLSTKAIHVNSSEDYAKKLLETYNELIGN